MKKKMVAFLCSAMLFLSAAASAEVISARPTYYNPANDIPEWNLRMFRDMTPEKIQEIRGGTFEAQLLPIDDDTLLWYGLFEDQTRARKEWHTLEYDGEIPSDNGYIVATDKQGNRKWSLGLSDPFAQNGFVSAWPLPDGRIMLRHFSPYGEWGSQYYIITQEGEVQDMLPAYKAKEYGVRETLRPMHGGYFGGGYHYSDGALSGMTGKANFAFFDENMNMVWQNQSEEYVPGSYDSIVEIADGFLVAGGVSTVAYTPLVSKIGLDGETKWIYKGHELSATAAGSVVPTADGGALFITSFDPTRATPYEAKETGTLVKLNGNGELEWVKQYTEQHPFSRFTSLVPYKEGFLLSGMLADDTKEWGEKEWAVLYVSADGTPIQRVDLELEAADFRTVSLVAAPDGDVYAYGSTATYEVEYECMEQKTDCRLFFLSMNDVLAP